MSEESRYWDSMARHGRQEGVIDPFDRGGYKNAYITGLRAEALLQAIGPAPQTVLDLGCGSGGMLEPLIRAGHRAVGIDISMQQLVLARGDPALDPAPLARYDGTRIPLSDGSIDAACTYVVLNHVVDDRELAALLAELRRVIRPGGRLAAIEQIRRRSRHNRALHTHQRALPRWLDLFAAAGFEARTHQTLRFGHFPLIYPIRYGLWPRSLHPLAARTERWLGRVHPQPWLDYADVLFVLEPRS